MRFVSHRICSKILFCIFLYLNVCEINVKRTIARTTSPSPLRSVAEIYGRNYQIAVNNPDLCMIFVALLAVVCCCISTGIHFTCRFLSFNTCINTVRQEKCRNQKGGSLLLLLIILYLSIFDFCLVILLPSEFLNIWYLPIKKRALLSRCVKFINNWIFIISLSALKQIVFLVNFGFMASFPYEKLAIWYALLHIILSADIHLNPGPSPTTHNYCGGFFSFCNWNLNSLSTDNFYRISLLEAQNTNFNYDIISLCETSLNDTVVVPENAFPGYKFHACNYAGGTKSGGVGMFYKETLPLRIREDLSFSECIVSELIFGHKKIFFTVLYRNPENKANTPEFDKFLENLENLYLKIKNENPFAMFLTGDFNAHSQAWYSGGDTNAEGILLDDLFSNLNMTQLICEPTHFFRDDCKPSCIDLIVTDQPNLVLNSGVRPSPDPVVRHQVTFCKINFKIPPLPKYNRTIWYFNRARVDLIRRAISNFPWEVNLLINQNPGHQVKLLNKSILNIMSNFVPNEVKTIRPQEPEWVNAQVKSLLRKQNKIFRKYKMNGYKMEHKRILERLKNECCDAIQTAKENYLRKLGSKLADPNTGQKIYWKILNKFLNKCKIPRIPPLFVQDTFITNCKEKASIFNNFFTLQCNPLENDSSLPELYFHTNRRMGSFEISCTEINDLISGLNTRKAHGPDGISVHMLKLCGPHISVPLKIIFDNILESGIFPGQWKEANVTPVH